MADSLYEKQLLDTLKLLEKSLKTIGSLPTQNISPSSANQQKSTRSAKKSKGEQAYENQLAAAANSFGGLLKRQKELADLTAKMSQMTKQELKHSAEGQKLQKAYNEALADSEADLRQNTSLNLQTREYQKLVNRQLHEQESAIRHQVKGINTLSTSLGKAQRGSSLLTASLMEATDNFREGSAEYSAWINELGESAKGLDVLGKSFLKSAGIVDNITGEMRDNISAKDFAGLRLRLGEAQETISESFAGLEHLGVNGLQDALNKITKISKMPNVAGEGARTPEQNKELQVLKEHLRTTAEKLAKANISMGEFADMFDENGKMTDKAFETLEDKADGLGKHLQSVGDTAAKVAKQQDALARSAHTASGKVDGFVRALKADPAGFAMDQIKGKLATTSAILGGLNKMADGLKRTWEDVQSYNIAQVPASFLYVQKASVKMGMSFEETTKFMQENKRMLAIYGSEGFDTLIGNTKDVFSKFGYSMKQAGEIVGPAIEAGISSGINVRSGEALNKFIDQSMDSFKNVSGITNITAKEYMALNAELLNAQDAAGTMVGMDQERAQAYARDIISLRNEYTQRGLSVQQATELLKIQQQQQREKVTSRVVGAAKGAALAASLGLSSDESSRYQQLSLKGNKTKDEMAELQSISSKMGKAMEEQRVNAYDQSLGAGLAKDVMYENLKPEGTAGQMIDKGVQFAQAERANVAMTPEESRKAGELAKGSEQVANLGNAANSVSSFFTNSLTVATLGATAALAGLALQAKGGMGGLLGGMGGKGAAAAGEAAGGAAGAASKGKGILGKAASAGKGLMSGAGKLLGKAAVPLMVLSSAWDGISGWNSASKEEEAGVITKEEASKKKGEAVGSATGGVGGALAGAAAGAAIGSVVPVIGTAIGGLVGGIAGSLGGSSIGGWIGEKTGGWFGSSKEEKKPLPTSEVTKDVTQVAKIKDVPEKNVDLNKSAGNVALIASLDKLTLAILNATPAFLAPKEPVAKPKTTKEQTTKTKDAEVKEPIVKTKDVEVKEPVVTPKEVQTEVVVQEPVASTKDKVDKVVTPSVDMSDVSKKIEAPLSKLHESSIINKVETVKNQQTMMSSVATGIGNMIMPGLGTITALGSSMLDFSQVKQPEVKNIVEVPTDKLVNNPNDGFFTLDKTFRGLANILIPGFDHLTTLGSNMINLTSKAIAPEVKTPVAKPVVKKEEQPIAVNVQNVLPKKSKDDTSSTQLINGIAGTMGNMLVPGFSTLTTIGSALYDLSKTKVNETALNVNAKPKDETLDSAAFKMFSGKNLIDAMLGQAVTDIVAPTNNLAVPTALVTPNFNQPGSQVKEKEVNSKSEEQKQTNTKDSPLFVSDVDANSHLTGIAESLITAVALLQQMSDAKNNTPQPIERRPPLVTQPVPTSYAYVTGRT